MHNIHFQSSEIFPSYDLGIKIQPFPKPGIIWLPQRPPDRDQEREQDAETARIP
jgi:hypothetical protein